MEKMTFLNEIGNTIKNSGYTCMIYKANELIFASEKRGVAPLIDFISTYGPDGDYSLADKVIGKAAALLCVKAGIRHVYAGVISEPALGIFNDHDISLAYDKVVPAIKNRTNTGLCPMEGLSKGVTDPEAMYGKIIEWLKGK